MILLEYLRMVGYTLVILTSLFSFIRRRYNPYLLIGDIIFAILTGLSLIHVTIFKSDRAFINNMFITPAVLVWAIFHFVNFLSIDGKSTNPYRGVAEKSKETGKQSSEGRGAHRKP